MLSKYHRNAILTGYIDAYCLVCESHLRCEEDINGHIAKPIHSKNLDTTNYLEKFKDDCVRKVKKGYFCEFCNVLLSTAAKAGLHVMDEKHSDNKGVQLLKRIGNNIIAFNNVLLNEQAWNSLIDDTCAICNVEFNNERIHKTEQAHILNLVQSKIEFGADKGIYRKIDDSSFQCVTCNLVFGINSFPTHFNEADHKKLYLECQTDTDYIKTETVATTHEQNVETAVINVKDRQTVTGRDVNIPTPHDVVPKKTEALEPTKKPEVSTVVNTESVTKKPTTTPVEVKKPEFPAGSKKDGHKFERATLEFDEEICRALNAKDYITCDEGGKRWCLLCDWTIDSVGIRNHVTGKHHRTLLKMHKERLLKNKMLKDTAKTEPEPVKVETSAEKENREKILDAVTKFQQNDIKINFESNTAACKKCNTNLEFDFKSIEAHIEEHNQVPIKKEEVNTEPVVQTNQKADSAKKNVATNKKARLTKEEKHETRPSSAASNKDNEEEIANYAKVNNLAYTRGGSKVYCRVCDSRIPSSFKNMKEHITGLAHKKKAAKYLDHEQSTKAVTVKKPMNKFIKTLKAVDNGVVKDVIINERYCINIFSFMLITCVQRLCCEACEVNLTYEQLDEHKATPSHKRAMCDTLVLASMESEFIREVRPDIVHCGTCNVALPSEDLDHHLNTTTHRESKTAASWRLQQYLPEIMQMSAEQQLQLGALVLLRMLANGDPFEK